MEPTPGRTILEDRADLRDMEEVLAKREKPIPWKQANARLGVK